MKLSNLAPVVLLSAAVSVGSCAAKNTDAKSPAQVSSAEQPKPEQAPSSKVERSTPSPLPLQRSPRGDTPFRLPDPERIYLEPPGNLPDFAEALSLCRAAMDGANMFMQSHLTDPGPKGCRTAQAFVDSKQQVIDVCNAAAETEIWDMKVMMIRAALRANIKKWREEVEKTKGDLPQCFRGVPRRVEYLF